MANGGGPPDGGQYPQQGGGYPPQQQGGGYPPPQGGGYPPQGQYGGGGGGYGGGPMSPQGRPLASWGKRVGAGLIDALVLLLPIIAASALLGVGAFAGGDLECTTNPTTGFTECTGGDTSFVVTLILAQLVPFIIQGLYSTFMNGGERGQTVGKRVVNIQVRDEATGGPIGYGKAFLRWLVGALLSVFTCGIGGILDILWPLWDNKRQTLHDKVVNSLVVETPQ